MIARKVLVVDDEPDIVELVSWNLQRNGFQVIQAFNGKEALIQAERHRPAIILLDLMMPEMDGLEVCRRLRSQPEFKDTLIIFVTAREEEMMEVNGFDAGADDYIVKPVRIRSLLKRIDALERRLEIVVLGGVLTFGRLVIDPERFLVILDGREIRLPRKEFELLNMLAAHYGKVIDRMTIFEEIWGIDANAVDRTIDVHVRRIRQKIGDGYIETVKGVGYKFEVRT